MLSDSDFVNKRFAAIARAAGIPPKKLERCRKRGRADSSDVGS